MKTTKLTVAVLKRRIEAHKKEIAKHRDALRDLLDDAEAIKESASQALDTLETACDQLSECL